MTFSPDFVLILLENLLLLSLCGAMFDLLGAIERPTNELWCQISNNSHSLMCKRLKSESVEPLGWGFGQFCINFLGKWPYFESPWSDISPPRGHRKAITCGWWAALTLTKLNKVGSALFWNFSPIWTQNQLPRKFSSKPFQSTSKAAQPNKPWMGRIGLAA